jgi:hypothetical protein
VKTKAMVRVRVVVAVEVPSVWGGDCSVSQVRAQGAEEAEGAVRKAIASDRRLSVLGVDALEMTVTNEAER